MKNHLVAAALACVAFTASAQAAPMIDFDIDGGPASNVVVDVDPIACFGCSVSTALASGLDDNVFSLAEGESETFNFFTITVRGLGAALVDVTATLAFDLPTGIVVVGQGTGGYLTVFGKVSAGTLIWDSLPTVLLSDGSSFDVSFSDILAFGAGNRATVTATITAVDAVPEPAALGLLGLGVLGLAATRRRKLAA